MAVKLDSKEALLISAQKLFSEKGYEGVSTRELAEAADVNLGAIQYHFGSKAKLFVATIQQLMHGSGFSELQSGLSTPIKSQSDAGERLCRYIFALLNQFICLEGPRPCRLMFREVFSNTSKDPEMFEVLISAVVQDYVKPLHETLVTVLSHLAPQVKAKELALITQSIIGQCSFYVTHRPFIERLHGQDFADSGWHIETASHISRFSLKAIGCNDEFINKCLANALEKIN